MKIFLNSLPRVIVNIATTVEFSEFGKSLGSAQTERVLVTDGFHLAALSNPSSQTVIRVTQEIRSNKTFNLLLNQTSSMKLFVRFFKSALALYTVAKWCLILENEICSKILTSINL